MRVAGYLFVPLSANHTFLALTIYYSLYQDEYAVHRWNQKIKFKK